MSSSVSRSVELRVALLLLFASCCSCAASTRCCRAVVSWNSRRCRSSSRTCSASSDFSSRELRLGFIQISPPRRKLGRFRFELPHPLFGHAEPLEAFQSRGDFLLAISELLLRRREFLFAADEFRSRGAATRPVPFPVRPPGRGAIAFVHRASATCASSRASHWATCCSRRSISAVRSPKPRLFGRKLFNCSVQLDLPVVEFALPTFDGRFAFFESVAALGPDLPIAIERGQPFVKFLLRVRQIGLPLAQRAFPARRALGRGRCVSCDRPSFERRLAFDERGFLRLECASACVEFLPLFFDPLLGVAELGVEVGFARGEFRGVLVDFVAFAIAGGRRVRRRGREAAQPCVRSCSPAPSGRDFGAGANGTDTGFSAGKCGSPWRGACAAS